MYLSDSFAYAYGIIEHMSENEIKHEQDTPVDVPSDGSDASSETPPPPPEFPYNPAKLPIVPPKSTSRKGLIILIVLLGLLSLGGGLAFAYYMLQGAKPKPAVANVATPAPLPTPKSAIADAVIYEVNTPDMNAPDCGIGLPSTSVIYRQSLSASKPVKILDLADAQTTINTDSFKNKILITTRATCNSKHGSEVWLSKDNGLTFAKLFETPEKAEWITSAKFSNDGNTIMFSYVANGINMSGKHGLKAIDIESKSLKDFPLTYLNGNITVLGYDKTKAEVYYNANNNDEETFKQLYIYSTATNKPTDYFNDKFISFDTQLTKDLKKGMRIRSTDINAAQRKSETPANYVIDQLDMQTKTKTTITTPTLDNVVPQAIWSGYTNDDESIYYTNEGGLYIVDKDGKSTLLLASTNIGRPRYVSRAVVMVGDNNDLTEFNINAKTNKAVFSVANDYATILEVIWK